MLSSPLVLASRRSPLAVAQTQWVRDQIARALDIPAADRDTMLPIKTYVTTGDQQQVGSLADSGGKGLFTKEIEHALLTGEANIAVHSMKDMPAQMPDGLVLAAVPKREDPRDSFLSANGTPFAELPEGSVIGTSSVRRAAQMRALRPDVSIVEFRGNVGTRLEKLKAGIAHGTFLAEAGLRRLNHDTIAREAIPTTTMLPAIGQGNLCVQCRADDETARAVCHRLNDPISAMVNAAERALIETLDGSCKTPIAGYGTIADNTLILRGEVLSLDGARVVREERQLPLNAMDDISPAAQMGQAIGQHLLAETSPDALHPSAQ